MSDERYEIREKLGQGGVGAVYKALDTQLNREVAIKRVLADGGYENQEEATTHLLKEATALSSVQHPHIVTVYDAGVDDDGPYVVMELIHGKTLDEMVERGTLTWNDLREIALQSQEALIAAQDLDLVHRDLKPSNVMVCWLPSGKFQVKIVDFGLAKFSAAPSLQTVDHGDSVFGSIFFMAPEQFERVPLDKRTDMYALGCLYYYSLTGVYPFNGETAASVMASHLQHHVTPLHELRPDIPKWGADWIMWHIERNMDDRPTDARTALERFLVLDKQTTQPVNLTAPDAQQPAPGAPKLLFPGTATPEEPPATLPGPESLTAAQTANTVNPLTAPQPIAPPQDSEGKLSPHTQAQKVSQPLDPDQEVSTSLPVAETAPQTDPPPPISLAPAPPVIAADTPPTPAAAPPTPAAAPPSPAIAVAAPPVVAPAAAAPAQEVPAQEAPAAAAILPIEKAGMPKGVKWAIIAVLAVTLIITAIVVSSVMGSRNETKLVNAVMLEAKALEDDNKLSDGISLTEEELQGVLNRATSIESNQQRNLVLMVLAFAKEDGSYDANATILNHITSVQCSEDIREGLFKDVMKRRKDTANIAPLLSFAKSSSEESSAAAAIDAARISAIGEPVNEYIDDFLSLIKDTNSSSVRSAAELAAADLITQSKSKGQFASSIIGAYESAVSDDAKFTMLRLVGTAGGKEASKTVRDALTSNDEAAQNAAVKALGQWADASEFNTLTSFIDDVDNDTLRKRAFDAAISFLKLPRKKKLTNVGKHWKALSDIAHTQYEKLKIIQGMATQKEQWAMNILTPYLKDKDDKVSDIAEKARAHLQKRIR